MNICLVKKREFEQIYLKFIDLFFGQLDFYFRLRVFYWQKPTQSNVMIISCIFFKWKHLVCTWCLDFLLLCHLQHDWPKFYQETLTGKRYLEFLQRGFPGFLETHTYVTQIRWLSFSESEHFVGSIYDLVKVVCKTQMSVKGYIKILEPISMTKNVFKYIIYVFESSILRLNLSALQFVTLLLLHHSTKKSGSCYISKLSFHVSA